MSITVAYPPLDATFTGSWRENGTFPGGWRPNPGADETVNVPYNISAGVAGKPEQPGPQAELKDA